jgi:hypothetical protein
MANSNSDHSKQLRYDTSNEWRKNNLLRVAVSFNLNNKEDVENYEIFENMDGKTADKFREIFRVYKKYKAVNTSKLKR